MENQTIKFFRIAVKFLSAIRFDLYEIIEILRSLGYTIIAPIPPENLGPQLVVVGQ